MASQDSRHRGFSPERNHLHRIRQLLVQRQQSCGTLTFRQRHQRDFSFRFCPLAAKAFQFRFRRLKILNVFGLLLDVAAILTGFLRTQFRLKFPHAAQGLFGLLVEHTPLRVNDQ